MASYSWRVRAAMRSLNWALVVMACFGGLGARGLDDLVGAVEDVLGDGHRGVHRLEQLALCRRR